jgi:hypothetical protein
MIKDTDTTPERKLIASLRALSPHDWLGFGVGAVAYVRPVTIEGEKVFAVHAADGTPLSVARSFDVACASVRQDDMEPVSVQ